MLRFGVDVMVEVDTGDQLSCDLFVTHAVIVAVAVKGDDLVLIESDPRPTYWWNDRQIKSQIRDLLLGIVQDLPVPKVTAAQTGPSLRASAMQVYQEDFSCVSLGQVNSLDQPFLIQSVFTKHI